MSFLAALPIIGNIIGGPVQTILDNLGEDDRREFEKAMAEIDRQYQLQIEQIKTNQAEAGHSSIFVAGWRPFIGWSCGGVFIIAAISGIIATFYPIPPEQLRALDTVKDMMFPILMGLLGLGGMRSFEKLKGVSRNKL